MPDPDTEMIRGTLDMLILKTLSVGPNHGYWIARRLRTTSDEVLLVADRTVQKPKPAAAKPPAQTGKK